MRWNTKSAFGISGDKLLADTNLLIRFLAGDEQIQRVVLDNDIHLSFITELELYAKSTLTTLEDEAIANLIAGSTVLSYEPGMRDVVIGLRRAVRTKLPDAIIAATAIFHKLPLLTRDADFTRIPDLSLISLS